MQLSQEQQKAAFCDSKKALVLAPAGSGKTRVLISRISYLIENGVSPYEILDFTFTRKASSELKTRLEKEVGAQAHKIKTGTIHGIALKFLQTYGELVGLRPDKITVYGSWEEQFLLKDVVMELGFHTGKAWKKVKKGEVDAAFNLYYTMGIRSPNFVHENVLMDAFFARCKENNALTYGTILTTFLRLIPKIAEYLNLRHILVDEVQDLDACHPPGTLIRKVVGKGKGIGCPYIHKDVPIEELKDGDRVVSWARRHGKLRKRGRKISLSKRFFSGDLIKVTCGQNYVLVTPDHKFYAKMNGNNEDCHAIYLMWRKDYGFRIGRCAIRYCIDTKRKPLSGIGARFTEEHTDKGWLLRIENKKVDSSIFEQVLSYKYGIPMTVFEPSSHTSKNMIDIIFSNTNGDGFSCLKDHDLSFDHPLYERNNKKGKKAPSKRYFETCAMNLIPELMSLPGLEENSPVKIDSIEKLPYSGYVYSMNVEADHTYIADGIIVKNCQWEIINKLCECTGASLFAIGDIRQSIFSFRGADPEYLIRNQHLFDVYNLRDNYRSSANIVEAANKLIAHNPLDLGEPMEAKRDGYDHDVIYAKNMDSSLIVKNIINYRKTFKEGIAVLARNHYLLKKLSRLLDEVGIKHEYIGKKTGLVRSENFRRFHAFLKLIVNPFDNFSFLLIKDYLGIYKYEYAEIRMMAVENYKSHFQEWKTLRYSTDLSCDWIYSAKNDDFDTVIDWMKDINFNFDTDEIFTFVYSWIIDNPTGTISQYLNWLATFDIQDEIKDDNDGLQLMTVHASKGLEFSTVILAGLNEGIFPDSRSVKENDLVDETRLFYVSMTRAEDQLIFTSRPVEDKYGKKSPVSRFVEWSLK